jgi:ATP-dependent helicase/nuclease subunit B
LSDLLKQPGEDVQLTLYALLWGGEITAAQFVSLDRDQPITVSLPGDIQALVHSERERLAQVYDAIAGKAPLPAQGSEAACLYCDMRGICRKDYWLT